MYFKAACFLGCILKYDLFFSLPEVLFLRFTLSALSEIGCHVDWPLVRQTPDFTLNLVVLNFGHILNCSVRLKLWICTLHFQMLRFN